MGENPTRRPTQPEGIPVDDWEVTPPPHEIPIVRPQPSATARAAKEAIDRLAADFAAHSAADTTALAKIDRKLDGHATILTGVQVAIGKLETSFTLAEKARDAEMKRLAEEHRARVERERAEEVKAAAVKAAADAAKAAIDAADADESRKSRAQKHKWIGAVAGQVGPPLAAFITGIVALTLAGRC